MHTDDLINEIHLYSNGKSIAVGILGVGYVTVLVIAAAAAGLLLVVALVGAGL